MAVLVDEISRVDQIMSANSPGKDLEELVILLVTPAVQQYFFDRVDSPTWLDPLASKGFFKDAPELVRDEKGVAIPRWPASGYLKRMASKSPQLVMKIIEEVPETGNTRVHEDFADAAAAAEMPAAIAARWATRETEWVSRQDSLYFLLPQKVGRVVSCLAGEGEVEAAIKLARALLAVLPGPQNSPESSEETPWGLPPEPRARFDLWEYHQVLKNNMPDLVMAAGKRSLGLLCDLLEDAIRISQPEGTPRPHDLSYIWRPAVEDHGQNLNLGLKPILVSAVRDAAEALAQRDAAQLQEIAETLEERGRNWLIFRRIVLHLLRVVQDPPPQLVASHLTDRTLFDEVGVRHEYLLLLKERFGSLPGHEQEIILRWISEGPDSPDLKTRLEQFAGRPVTDEEVGEYRQNWQRERLEPIAAYLAGDWKARYEALTKETTAPRGARNFRFIRLGAP